MAGSSSRTPIVLVTLLMFVVGLAGAYFIRGATNSDDGFTQATGEVFLEPANTLGPEPFSETPLAADPLPVHTQAKVATATSSTTAAPGTTVSESGTRPGLYGGSNDTAVCDAAGIARFLTNNPDKAAAWVKGINADPDLYLPDDFPDTAVTVDNLDTYLATLTPLLLRSDMRVTNNGFKNGQPTPRQSVLQAGTAVLVDSKGVPRAKCMCGNPLSPPVPTPITPTYTGGDDDWPDGEVTPTVMFPGPEPVEKFTVCRSDDPNADCETIEKPTNDRCPNLTIDPSSCLEGPDNPPTGGDTPLAECLANGYQTAASETAIADVLPGCEQQHGPATTPLETCLASVPNASDTYEAVQECQTRNNSQSEAEPSPDNPETNTGSAPTIEEDLTAEPSPSGQCETILPGSVEVTVAIIISDEDGDFDFSDPLIEFGEPTAPATGSLDPLTGQVVQNVCLTPGESATITVTDSAGNSTVYTSPPAVAPEPPVDEPTSSTVPPTNRKECSDPPSPIDQGQESTLRFVNNRTDAIDLYFVNNTNDAPAPEYISTVEPGESYDISTASYITWIVRDATTGADISTYSVTEAASQCFTVEPG